jgi:cytochrome c oxidase assembly protein subunit 15
MSPAVRRRLALWLFACAAMVWLTLVVGGATRLTQSGLSIVEWRPVVGAIPPLGEEAWQEVFAAYRESPEYRLVNAGIGLDEFKRIFWWEYAHRLIGRLDGAVFLLPFAWFLWRRDIRGRDVARLAGIFVLGGAQGALGWYMVKSGLVDQPHVSQYRLAAHLALAFGLFAALVWTALGYLSPRAPLVSQPQRGSGVAAALALLVFVMVVSGAFVAGLHAGKMYNTFPLMAGSLVPAGILGMEPWYANFFANPTTAQFDHRLGAWLLAVVLPGFAWTLRRMAAQRVRTATRSVLAFLALQVVLGIATLLLAVPVVLGTLHQANALLLFGAVLWLNHELRVADSIPSERQNV